MPRQNVNTEYQFNMLFGHRKTHTHLEKCDGFKETSRNLEVFFIKVSKMKEELT